VIVQIRAREISRRKNDAVSRVVADHIMWIGGEQVFTGTGAWTIQPSALFQRLRRSAAAHAPAATIPEPAATTARLQTATGVNVVISAPRESEGGGGVTASLVVDASHPYFFDHACDHVPGMLLLEGCAQLALVADAAAGSGDASTRVASYEMTFAQFVERHVPATLTAHVDAGYAGAERRVSIGISQNGSECGRATIGLRSAGR
jgi:hypothetical protein